MFQLIQTTVLLTNNFIDSQVSFPVFNSSIKIKNVHGSLSLHHFVCRFLCCFQICHLLTLPSMLWWSFRCAPYDQTRVQLRDFYPVFLLKWALIPPQKTNCSTEKKIKSQLLKVGSCLPFASHPLPTALAQVICPPPSQQRCRIL